MTNAVLLETLQARFAKHMERHENMDWDAVQHKLKCAPHKLAALLEMEKSGGEPDVVDYDQITDTYLFVDCAPESPAERRSLCYDDEALQARKKNKPSGSAMGMAARMGVELLDSDDYRSLQALGAFDLVTSSWVRTPQAVRDLGGALFCDRRYERVFIYHNGAESYYASRGFRAKLHV